MALAPHCCTICKTAHTHEWSHMFMVQSDMFSEWEEDSLDALEKNVNLSFYGA